MKTLGEIALDYYATSGKPKAAAKTPPPPLPKTVREITAAYYGQRDDLGPYHGGGR